MFDMRVVGWDWGLVTDSDWLACLLGDLCVSIPVYH